MYSIGLMSGTSMDGIDVALIETDGEYFVKEHHNYFLEYDELTHLILKLAEQAFKQSMGEIKLVDSLLNASFIKSFLKNQFGLSEKKIKSTYSAMQARLEPYGGLTLSAIIAHSTQCHAKAIHEFGCLSDVPFESISVIGYHGQTFYHQPEKGISVIVGDAQVLANLTHCPVVNDFRSSDIALGGEGAPLAPIYHHALAMRDRRQSIAVVNCGGIANVSFIHDENRENMVAFDTGPGNGLIDRFVKIRTAGKERMDRFGQYGKRGKVNEAVLEKLFQSSVKKNGKNFFDLPPPKSLDSHDLVLIPELENLSLEDGCRTLEAFTAESIARSVMFLGDNLPDEWILVGGGWNNPVICEELQKRLRTYCRQGVVVYRASEVNWNSQAMEAQLMAYLAVRCLEKKPISFPKTTGVKQAAAGGKLYLPA